MVFPSSPHTLTHTIIYLTLKDMQYLMHSSKSQLPPGVWTRGQEQLQCSCTTGSMLSCKFWVEPSAQHLKSENPPLGFSTNMHTMVGALSLTVRAKSHSPTVAATYQSGVSQRMFLKTRYKLCSKKSTFILARYSLGSKYT